MRPGINGVAERANGIIQNAALVAWIQVLILYPYIEITPSETLRAEAVTWACEIINDTATSTLVSKSSHKM